jgi:hypothetical protein
VIPKAMRDALGVRQGDELLVVLDGKRMMLTRPEEHARGPARLRHRPRGGTASQRIRAPGPDALLLATPLREDAQAFLTNDTRVRAEGLTVMVLADYV